MKIKDRVFVTNSFEETQKLGEDFARSLLAGMQGETLNVALYGDLGAGKTTFVQGLAKGLGIKRRIISPTFMIVRSYELGVMGFYHIDLYRTEGNKDIETLGLEEILNDPKNIVVIEWAEKVGDLLPKKRWEIRFEYLGEDKRNITIRNF